ncbi:GAF domain-containing protein [Archangium gephyra]|uniref:GAF domain-containing protein n=1 Tax=Archangium gephyra TaxID=48 RepID=UPI003B827FCE
MSWACAMSAPRRCSRVDRWAGHSAGRAPPWTSRRPPASCRSWSRDWDRKGLGSSERSDTLSLADRFPRVLDAGRRIASALTREAVFDAARRSMMELLRPEHCVVFDPEALLPEDELAAAGVGRTAIGRTLETGRPAVMGQGMPGGVSESMELLGVRSLLCAPIQVRGKTVACVCVSHRQVGSSSARTRSGWPPSCASSRAPPWRTPRVSSAWPPSPRSGAGSTARSRRRCAAATTSSPSPRTS